MDAGAKQRIASDLADLVTIHAKETAWLQRGRAAQRAASQGDRTLAWRRIYAPYPTELRVSFGCGCTTLSRTRGSAGGPLASRALPSPPAPRSTAVLEW